MLNVGRWLTHEWINRYGIILNFFAGFLLAPELLGITRLQRAENAIERTLMRSKELLSPFVSLMAPRPLLGELKLVSILVFCAAMSAALYATAFHYLRLAGLGLVATLALCVVAFVVATVALLFVKDEQWSDVLMFGVYAVLVPIMIVGYFIPRLIDGIVGALVRLLEGDGRLRAWLIVTGILFFIVGNFAQLWATF